jgi:hypothetical protein
MTVTEIIEALKPDTRVFAREAVEAAIAQREEVTPHLLHALEQVAAAPEKAAESGSMLPIYVIYLLAQFREQGAYRPLSKILAAPGDVADRLFGDTVTERMSNILASVYDGEPGPLKRLVESDEVYDFVRWAAVETFLVLVHTGQMRREEVVDYYRELFHGKLRPEYNHVWDALANAVADLPAPELIQDLRRIYEEGLADPGVAGLDELEKQASVPFENKPKWRQERFSGLIADAISEMEWWACFDENEDVTVPDEPEMMEEKYEPPTAGGHYEPVPEPVPYVRSGPKIGRNDPCPCGSGKKYKKCCLGKGL